MTTTFTNVNIVGNPDYYLELASGKSSGNVSLTRKAGWSNVQLNQYLTFYRFKLTSGDPSSDSINFYELISSDNQHLTASMENGVVKFKLDKGSGYIDLATITPRVSLELDKWYSLRIKYSSSYASMYFSLSNSEPSAQNEIGNDKYYIAGKLKNFMFNVANWNLNFSASQAGVIVSKDTKIYLEDSKPPKAAVDLSDIDWDPTPIESFGTTNAI